MKYPYPEPVFRYFAELSDIPRGSGNTDGIRTWCLKTAEKLGINVHTDNAGNVIIRKEASAGYEQHTPVILQGHLDMVCAKLPDCKTDMTAEPPHLIWEKDAVHADGTTLGGDDGIAIAYCLALLEQNTLPHPPLTVILTNDEETGMDGAAGISPDELTGEMLINLDSEEEGVLTVGCAGGVRVHMSIPYEAAPASGTTVRLTLRGLTGGHSGTEINRPLLNANTALANILASVNIPLRIGTFQGGIRDNAIPTDCSVLLFCQQDDAAKLICRAETEALKLKAEYPEETGLLLCPESGQGEQAAVLTDESTAKFIQFLNSLPNGVQEMNTLLNMPETSLNIGVVSLCGGTADFDTLIRSGTNAKKDALADLLCEKAALAGGTSTQSGCYPAWEYLPDSRLEQTAKHVFRRLYGKDITVETIHAGLECGILSSKKPGLQCVSIGPDLFDVHTPRERLSIPSAARTWEYLTALLAEI